MTWTLFLDDERELEQAYPEIDSLEWLGSHISQAHSSKEAKSLVMSLGCPAMLLLDHDLGADDTSMKFLRWLFVFMNGPSNYNEVNGWNNDDNPISLPPPKYRIHSANPVGVANIQSFMESWKKSLE